MHSGRSHREDSGTSSGSTFLDVLEPTCSFAVGHHSCRLHVVVKDDKWFLYYSLSNFYIFRAIMKCAYKYDIPLVFLLHDHVSCGMLLLFSPFLV